MNRTDFFIAVIAYTLIAWFLLTQEGSDLFWFAYIPLYLLVVAIPVYVVAAILVENVGIERGRNSR